MTLIQSPGRNDAFGNLISEITNVINIEGQHPYNQERWRYFIENASTGELNPEYIQYGNSTAFTDGDDFKTITPGEPVLSMNSRPQSDFNTPLEWKALRR